MNSSSSTIKSSNININERESDSEEVCLLALQIASCSVLPMALKTALDLDLFEVMAKAGPNAYLSPLEISSQLGGTDQNPDAPAMLGRILRLLTAFSILKCSSTRTVELLNNDEQQADQDGQVDHDDQTTRLFYGLGPVCKYFTRNEDGVSLAPLALLLQDKVLMDSWYHLKDVFMEGGIPFNRAHGMSVFEYPGIDLRFNKLLNNAMSGHTTLTMKKVLETYKGFEDLKELVDVGGGVGITTNLITSKYPQIKGTNFDLPHVLADAPSYPGVEHVEGDMFESVPRGEAIFMKWILHDWSDEHCLKLLKNCYEALPNSGKVIIVEYIVPMVIDTSVDSKFIFELDLILLAQTNGGKERTFKEFEALAKQSGFARCETICTGYHSSIMEFHKTAKN